jgi:hypothetical protein
MKYQDYAEALQADEGADLVAARLAEAKINPATALATDYLNHFNERSCCSKCCRAVRNAATTSSLAADELSSAFRILALQGPCAGNRRL